MKKISNKSVLITFLTLSTLFLFTSCLPDPAEPSSFLQIGVQVEGIDSTFTSGNDSLTIDRVRLIHGASFFVIDEDSTIQISRQARQLTFATEATETAAIYGSIFPEGVYEELHFVISTASDTVVNLDPIFLDGGEFSLIAEGTYKDSSFTFKSSTNFIYPFEFIPPISVSGSSEVFTLLISANIQSWFGKTDGSGFYSPFISSNDSLINENIAESFTIEQLQP